MSYGAAMAGDWIKFAKATHTKPEVYAIAEALAIEPDAVVGRLLKVWGWFDENTESGNVASVTSVTLVKLLDEVVGCPGFAEAMQKVGWLAGNSLPKFERHNGETAKNRALTRERVRQFRASERNAGSVTREEKRREEVKESTTPSGLPPDDAHAVKRKAAVKIGERMVAYLNEKAGTKFKITDVNAELARARVMADGATEADIRAVIDAKVAEWGADPEMRKFLRPATLFARTNFAQYVGQLASRLPEPEKKKRVGIYMKHMSGKLDGITQIYIPAASKADHGALAKEAARRYGAQLPTTARYIVIDVDGEDRHTFSLEELR